MTCTTQANTLLKSGQWDPTGEMMMASISDRVRAVAESLIVAVGMTHAVMVTDIQSHAAKLHQEFGEYSQRDISQRIASEIKKTHRPGISGSI